MNALIMLTIALALITIILICTFYLTFKKKMNVFINQDEQYKNDDELLMIRYNYVINLKKIDSFTKELLNCNVDKRLLDYIKEYTEKINSYIYDDSTYTKTINFENEMLYKNEIINLDIVFYAYNHLFNTLDKTYLKILNNKIKLKKEIEKKEKGFKKSLNVLKRKSKNIMKERNNLEKYYLRIEEMKNSYKEYINRLNPIITILFIDYCIDVISDRNSDN